MYIPIIQQPACSLHDQCDDMKHTHISPRISRSRVTSHAIVSL